MLFTCNTLSNLFRFNPFRNLCTFGTGLVISGYAIYLSFCADSELVRQLVLWREESCFKWVKVGGGGCEKSNAGKDGDFLIVLLGFSFLDI